MMFCIALCAVEREGWVLSDSGERSVVAVAAAATLLSAKINGNEAREAKMSKRHRRRPEGAEKHAAQSHSRQQITDHARLLVEALEVDGRMLVVLRSLEGVGVCLCESLDDEHRADGYAAILLFRRCCSWCWGSWRCVWPCCSC